MRVPKEIKESLSPGEDVIKVAHVQRRKDMVHPKTLIITTNRAIIYDPGFVGCAFEDFPFSAVTNIEFKKGLLSSGIVINTSGGTGKVEGLPKSDASEAFKLMRQYWQAYREGR
jgi:hypothetical protein